MIIMIEVNNNSVLNSNSDNNSDNNSDDDSDNIKVVTVIMIS